MGNAAAKPITSKEISKYGIALDRDSENNKSSNSNVNSNRKKFDKMDSKKKENKGKKQLEPKDIENIHNYCCQETKKKASTDRNLRKLVEKNHSATDVSSSGVGPGSLIPSMISLEEGDDLSVL